MRSPNRNPSLSPLRHHLLPWLRRLLPPLPLFVAKSKLLPRTTICRLICSLRRLAPKRKSVPQILRANVANAIAVAAANEIATAAVEVIVATAVQNANEDRIASEAPSVPRIVAVSADLAANVRQIASRAVKNRHAVRKSVVRRAGKATPHAVVLAMVSSKIGRQKRIPNQPPRSLILKSSKRKILWLVRPMLQPAKNGWASIVPPMMAKGASTAAAVVAVAVAVAARTNPPANAANGMSIRVM